MTTQAVTPTSTIPPQDPVAAWRETRKTGIGGSDVHALLNITTYGKGCARSLMFEKTGTEPDYPFNADPDLLKRGNKLEAIVADEYEEQTGRKVRRAPMDDFGVPIPRRSKEYPWALVNTDRSILAGHGGVTDTGDLELKTHGQGPFIALLRDGLPPSHILQVQHSMLVTGHKWGAIAVLQPDTFKLKHFDINRSEEVIDEIKKAGDAFWTLKEKGGLPAELPDAQDMRCKVCQYRITCRGEAMDEQAAAMMKAQKEGKVHLVQISDPELATTIANRELLAQEIKAAEEQKALLDDQIKAAVKQHGEAILVGDFKVYCKPMVSNRVDLDALKKAEPELVKKYTKANPGEYYRVYGL